ncbi:response regulator [Jeotgalibacillus marinus]|uniref:Response regulator transcription factor n=1 Tax=Jeotgalibacillus marinus TaxID=86667 RepID=A0ABV3Q4E7_9BACL
MYKVLLVDDEPLIIEGMKALIPWEDYGLEIAGEAYDGSHALQLLQENTFDIMITDIKMPKMTGLELIFHCKELNKDTKYIVLSGFQEFEYIKKGLKLGIENYLLKPVNEEELINTIENVIEKKKKDTREDRNRASYVLRDNMVWRLLNHEIDEKEWRQRADLYHLSLSDPVLTVAMIQFGWNAYLDQEALSKARTEIEDLIDSVCIISPDNDFVAILSEQNEKHQLETIERLKVYLHKSDHFDYFYLSIGRSVSSAIELPKSYDLASELATYQLILEPNTIITEKIMEHFYDNNYVKQQDFIQLTKYVLNEDIEKANTWLDDTFLQFAEGDHTYPPSIIRQSMIELVISVQKLTPNAKFYPTTRWVDLILKSHSLEELRKIVEQYLNELIEAFPKQTVQRSSIIQSILEYIHDHYDEEISLKTLSQRFHINSIYLGQLFHKELGIVFSEYINQHRIEKAKELLKSTHQKAGKIGKSVGYSDTTYFYKKFKKSVGVTPTEWRSMQFN